MNGLEIAEIGLLCIALALFVMWLFADSEPRMLCERCQGKGEIVTDWDRYLEPQLGDKGDEGTAECPECDGIGWLE